MQLDQNVSLESADLVANIPIRSSNDFRMNFAIIVPSLENPEQREEIVRRLKESLPFLMVTPAWSGQSVLQCSLADQDKSGISKYTLKMFQDAGLKVSAMGSPAFTQPPHLANSPEPENLPYSFKNFATFKELLCGTVNAVMNGTKVSVPSTAKPGIE